MYSLKRPWSLNFSRQKLLAVTLLEVVAYLFLAKNSGGRLIGTTMALLILQPSDSITAGQLIDTYGPLTIFPKKYPAVGK